MNKAAGFLKSIKKGDNVVIIFNNDADGMCSCALVDGMLKVSMDIDTLLIPQPMPMAPRCLTR